MTPLKDLAFASDDELLDDHNETFSQVKLQMKGHAEGPSNGLDSYDEVPLGQEAMEIDQELRSIMTTGTLDICDLPQISVTPMTPRSLSPDDDHSTVTLNSNGGSPRFQSQKYRGQMTGNANWRAQSPMPSKSDIEAKDFFAYRDSIVAHVLQEVEKLVEPTDGALRGTWLLTEIDNWDNEKERIVVLCEKALLIVKYDFIGMKKEDYRRVLLAGVDRILQGEIKYPQRSIAPRLSGIAGGLVGVMKDCIIPTVQGTVESVGSAMAKRSLPKSETVAGGATAQALAEDPEPPSPPPSHVHPVDANQASKTSLVSALALENFEPRARNVEGIRLLWDEEAPPSFSQKWNPFNKSIPWITFTSHPLLWHKGGCASNRSFDVESFSRELIDVLSEGGGGKSPICRIEYKPIIIETYVGIASLFHNANSLGFYKVRGKVSF